MVAGGGDKEASVEVFRTYILCNSESLVTDLPVHNSRKLSPRFRRTNAFTRSCFRHTLPTSIN